MAAYDPTDPHQLTQQQRLDAIAAILAVGAGRALALGGAAPLAPAAGLSDSSQNQLDVSAEMGLHVPRS